MVNEDLVRIRHMLDASKKASSFAQGRKRDELESDEQLSLALIRLLEVIGEAAKGVSSSSRQQYPEIAWKEIAGTRDRLIHGYFDVDLDIVWEIITDDIPLLIIQLEKIISNN
ncbi:DUF86 domain-containing protein [Candidatus Margulisiibacteriota bacterium]